VRNKIEKLYEWLGFENDNTYGAGLARLLSWFTSFVIVVFVVARIGFGMADANNALLCRANSINDILLSPLYALGCNLAKDRFDVRLN